MISADFAPGAGVLGGLLIGAAAVLLLAMNGRIAGISGILSGMFLADQAGERGWRVAFILGLVLGGVLFRFATGGFAMELQGGWPALVVAGLLVGFGTRMGAGCTSGHGVCGLARGRKRSLVATCTFMSVAIFTVWLMKFL